MWEIIVTGIVSLLSGAGITFWINPKAFKKKADLENEALSIAALKDAIAEVRSSNDHLQTVIADREDEINKLREENLSKDKDIILCQSMLCKKMCCKTRQPISGLGEKFFNDLKSGKEKLDYENQ